MVRKESREFKMEALDGVSRPFDHNGTDHTDRFS